MFAASCATRAFWQRKRGLTGYTGQGPYIFIFIEYPDGSVFLCGKIMRADGGRAYGLLRNFALCCEFTGGYGIRPYGGNGGRYNTWTQNGADFGYCF
jgi:hypothetical protein